MNKYLMSSILGSEFINYRKNTGYSQRNAFLRSVPKGSVGIVVDSVDDNISKLLSGVNKRFLFGKEYVVLLDTSISNILTLIVDDLNKNVEKMESKINLNQFKFKLGLEDGSFVSPELTVGFIYRKHAYSDKILYLLLTKELTMYSYIMSIIKSVLGFKKIKD